jgi:hypothetical protein
MVDTSRDEPSNNTRCFTKRNAVIFLRYHLFFLPHRRIRRLSR